MTNGLGSELAAIWCSLLRLPEVNPQLSFVALGGTSVLAAQMVARVRRIGVTISVREILQGATIEDLVARTGAAQTATIERQPQPDTPEAALSVGQEAMLLRGRRSFVTFTAAISGRPDVTRLRHALAILPWAHDALRMKFVKTGDTWNAELRSPAESAPQLDVIALPPAVPAADLEQRIQSWFGWFREQPDTYIGAAFFDAGEHSKLVIAVDHLVFDGESIEIILQELSKYYLAETDALPQPAFGFVEYAARQRREPELNPATMSYWRDVFSRVGPYPHLALPHLKGREGGPAPRAERCTRAIPADLLDQFHSLCRSHEATPFMGYLASLTVAIHRKHGQAQHLGVNTATAGRSWPGTEDLIGSFADEITLDLGVTSLDFGTALANVRQAILAAMQHDRVARRDLLRHLCPGVDMTHRYTPYLWFSPPDDVYQLSVPLGSDAILSRPKLLIQGGPRIRPFPGLSLEVETYEQPQLVCEFGQNEYPSAEATDLLDVWAQVITAAVRQPA